MKKDAIQLSLFQKALILVAVPLVFELILLGSLYGLLVHAEQEADRAEHAKTVIAKTTEVVQLLFDAGIEYIAYDAATKSLFEKRLMHTLHRIPKEMNNLENLVQNNNRYLTIVQNVRKESSDAIDTLLASKQELQAGGRMKLVEALSLRDKLNDCVAQLGVIIKTEKATQVDPARAPRLRSLVYFLLGFGVFMSILIAFLLVKIFHDGTTRRLQALMNNSHRMSMGQALTPPLSGNDEIAKLDHAFHYAAEVMTEAARKERAVFENAADVITTINKDNIITAISPAAQVVLGWDPAELAGKEWQSLVATEDQAAFEAWIAKLKTIDGSLPLENRCLAKDGRLVDMLWSGHWSASEKSLFCVAHNITERKQLERFKQEFSAMVSHDLRTPLTAVQSTLAILGKGAWGELSEKAHKKVEVAESNIKQSIELINSLLDLEKMETAKFELNLDDVSMLSLIKRSVESVSQLAEKKQIRIVLPARSIEVMGDPEKLARVITNLMGNAIKFAPEQSQIEISLVEDEDFVIVKVTDEGPGIPPEMRDSIFDRFKQLDGNLQAKKEGSGLGLAICRAIIEAHNGTIGVDSNGVGSTFWFRIPAEQTLVPVV